jgi:tripeptide aminopeptidase
MINEPRLMRLFKRLCLADSPALKEGPSFAICAEELDSLGISWHEDGAAAEIEGTKGNIIAHLPGSAPGPHIFFSAHIDTVEPTAGLDIIEEGGILRSNGRTILGADDKAGVAPILEAMRVIKETGMPHGPVTLLLSVAEEIGLKGAAAMKLDGLGLDYGYILDTGPPVGSFVNRTAFHDAVNARIVGKAAHAGKHPEDGINAIQVAADAISRMKLGRISEDTTASFGIIQGGSAVNVVCPSVVLRGEARSTSEADLQAQVDHMIAELNGAAERWGAEVRVEHFRHYPGYFIEPDHQCLKIGLAAAEALGLSYPLRTTLGGSDANIFNANGLPCVVCGTGMEEIHTHQEWIKTSDLVLLTELVLEIIRQASASPAAGSASEQAEQ